MARPRRGTRRKEIAPLGVAERLKDAPPTRYAHNPKPPPATYTDPATGVLHRTDGTCHDECRDWR